MSAISIWLFIYITQSRILMLFLTAIFSNIFCSKGKNLKYIIVEIKDFNTSHQIINLFQG